MGQGLIRSYLCALGNFTHERKYYADFLHL